MLRTFSNRIGAKASIKNFGCQGRNFSTPPRPPLKNQKPAVGSTGVISLLTIALLAAVPVVYIKTGEIQLMPEIENVIGTLLGTEAVLFLRPPVREETESSLAPEHSSESLYNPGETLIELTENTSEEPSAESTEDSSESVTPVVEEGAENEVDSSVNVSSQSEEHSSEERSVESSEPISVEKVIPIVVLEVVPVIEEAKCPVPTTAPGMRNFIYCP